MFAHLALIGSRGGEARGSYGEGVAKLDADVWFRFHSARLSTAGADLQRLKEGAQTVGFELRGARVTPAAEDESRPGWSEKTDRGTNDVPLDPEP
jgi:hypothetical protein